MTMIWCDTETTGIEPTDSGAFEIAMLVYRDSQFLGEKVFYLNPLNETIKFGIEAYQVNGVPEEKIRSYPPAEKVIPEIAEFLKQFVTEKKLIFAGYKCGFDYKHLKALFERYGYQIDSFFNGRYCDVYEYVKKLYERGGLPPIPNKKLETVCKALRVEHEDAHTALSDIWATRKLYEAIYKMGRKEP